jgi:hypothetical protein
MRLDDFIIQAGSLFALLFTVSLLVVVLAAAVGAL